MSKVLLVDSSPNKEGYVYIALTEVAKALEKYGIEVEIYHTGVKHIRDFITNFHCSISEECNLATTCNKLLENMKQADGIAICSLVNNMKVPLSTLGSHEKEIKNVAKLEGRFGNMLWKIGAAIKIWGEGNFIAAYSSEHIQYLDWFRDIEFKPLSSISRHNLKETKLSAIEITEVPRDSNYISSYPHNIGYIQGVNMLNYLSIKPTENDFTILHVRGTDYLKWRTELILKGEQYKKVINNLGISENYVKIITDDPCFSRYILPEYEILNLDAKDAFCYMMGCKNLICSSGTFAWWAGYLGKHENVFIPDLWGPGRASKEYYGILFPGVRVL